jgi:hypothetical protein
MGKVRKVKGYKVKGFTLPSEPRRASNFGGKALFWGAQAASL